MTQRLKIMAESEIRYPKVQQSVHIVQKIFGKRSCNVAHFACQIVFRIDGLILGYQVVHYVCQILYCLCICLQRNLLWFQAVLVYHPKIHSYIKSIAGSKVTMRTTTVPGGKIAQNFVFGILYY